MASSGSILGTTQRTNGNIGPYDFYLNWQQISIDATKNESIVKVNLTLQRNDGSNQGAQAAPKSLALKIGGVSYTVESSQKIDTTNKRISQFASWTCKIEHDADGSFVNKNIHAYFETSIAASLKWGKIDSTISLEPARSAALISNFACSTAYFDGTLSCAASQVYMGFTYSWGLYIEGKDNAIYADTGIDPNFTIWLSDAQRSDIYSALPNRTSGVLTLKLTTMKNGVQIGQVQQKSLTLNIPTSVKPSITSINVASKDKDYLFKSMNRAVIEVTNAKPGAGSEIDRYEVIIKDSSNNLIQSLTCAPDFLGSGFGPFEKTEELNFTLSAIDKRGRKSNSVTDSITCHDYFRPSFREFNIYRSNGDGKEDEKGTYISYTYTPSYKTILDNSITVSLYVNGTSTNARKIKDVYISTSTFSSTSTHQAYLTISDSFYTGQPTPTKTILTAERILNVAPDGKSLAIGKKAGQGTGGLFECQWDAKFNGNVRINGDLTFANSGLIDMIYPVGSIYMSVNSTSPATLFGGTWEQIQDRFLLAASSGDYAAGSTGGYATTTLSANNLPAHNHTAKSTYSGASFDIRAGSNDSRYLIAAGENTTMTSGGGASKWDSAFSISTSAPSRKNDKVSIGGTVTTTINNTGSGEAFNNMPPYLAVYMWKRKA